MKHLFALLFVLFFGFNAQATTCPVDKPLQDIKGNCYSCDDERTFIRPHQLMDDEYYIQRDFILYKDKGHCLDACPNRIEYNDGWMDADNFCVTNTPINKITAYLISNIMSILFNPLNWVNLFLLIFVFSNIFTLILKKHKNRLLSIGVKIFSIFLSLVLTLIFLNNLFITLFGLVFIIYIKIKSSPKEKIKRTGKSCLHFIKIVFLILVLLFLIAGLLIFLGNNL
ncbi:MAG: hypothetical protein IKS41_04920 [Alphaproteobacteria bacterium]|nr:hypothetical protein [Alphaproteobacteria bacterium]